MHSQRKDLFKLDESFHGFNVILHCIGEIDINHVDHLHKSPVWDNKLQYLMDVFSKNKSFFSIMCRWKVLPFVTCAIDQLNGKWCLPATELIGKWLTHRWIFYGCITNRDRLSPWVPNQRPSIIMWTKDIKACLQYFHFLCRKSGYHVKPLKVQETKNLGGYNNASIF